MNSKIEADPSSRKSFTWAKHTEVQADAPVETYTIDAVAFTSDRDGADVYVMPARLFGGIGSEAYEALRLGRRAVGAELKLSYFTQAVANCHAPMNACRDIPVCAAAGEPLREPRAGHVR